VTEKQKIRPKTQPAPAPRKEEKEEKKVYDVAADPDETWGPYADYTFVQTPHGEFAVPASTIMHIEMRKEWSKKEGRNVIRPRAVYEEVRINDLRLKPLMAMTLEERQELADMRAERGQPELVE